MRSPESAALNELLGQVPHNSGDDKLFANEKNIHTFSYILTIYVHTYRNTANDFRKTSDKESSTDSTRRRQNGPNRILYSGS